MGLNKVPTKGWIKIGIVIAIMVGVLIFKPEWSTVQGKWIIGGVSAILVYMILKVTGILKKIFGKK